MGADMAAMALWPPRRRALRDHVLGCDGAHLDGPALRQFRWRRHAPSEPPALIGTRTTVCERPTARCSVLTGRSIRSHALPGARTDAWVIVDGREVWRLDKDRLTACAAAIAPAGHDGLLPLDPWTRSTYAPSPSAGQQSCSRLRVAPAGRTRPYILDGDEPFARCRGGLPDHFDGNIALVADGAEAAWRDPTARSIARRTAGRRRRSGLGCGISMKLKDAREQWFTPWGGPPATRSMAIDDEGGLYANVHAEWAGCCGPTTTSSTTARSWQATALDIRADAHQDSSRPQATDAP